MIGIDILMMQMSGLERQDLERWIANDWIRPDRRAGAFVFNAIDVSRVRLIHQLRNDLQIDEDALPVILSLLDQLYDLHRHLRRLGDAMDRTLPDDLRDALVAHMDEGPRDSLL